MIKHSAPSIDTSERHSIRETVGRSRTAIAIAAGVAVAAAGVAVAIANGRPAPRPQRTPEAQAQSYTFRPGETGQIPFGPALSPEATSLRYSFQVRDLGQTIVMQVMVDNGANTEPVLPVDGRGDFLVPTGPIEEADLEAGGLKPIKLTFDTSQNPRSIEYFEFMGRTDAPDEPIREYIEVTRDSDDTTHIVVTEDGLSLPR